MNYQQLPGCGILDFSNTPSSQIADDHIPVNSMFISYYELNDKHLTDLLFFQVPSSIEKILALATVLLLSIATVLQSMKMRLAILNLMHPVLLPLVTTRQPKALVAMALIVLTMMCQFVVLPLQESYDLIFLGITRQRSSFLMRYTSQTI